MHAEFGEATGPREHLAFQRADGAVVGVHAVGQGAAHPREMAGEYRQSLVQVAGEVAYLAGIFGKRDLAPAVGHRLEQRHEAGGRREDHVLVERLVQEPGVLGEGCAEELVTRDEQDHELRAALELRPVALGRQLTNAFPHLARVPLERRLAGNVVGRFHRGQIGIQRRFHVHHQLPAFRQVHHHVGAQHAAVPGDGVLLLGEVAVLDHAGQFHQPPQRHLAPLASHLGPAQGGHQVAGLGTESLLAEADGLEQAAYVAERFVPLFLDLCDLPLGALQRLANRHDQRFDRLLARLELAARLAAVHIQVLLRQREEVLAVVLQRPLGQLVEHARQALLRQRESLLALVLGAAARLELALRHRQLFPQPRGARLQQQQGSQYAQQHAAGGPEDGRPGGPVESVHAAPSKSCSASASGMRSAGAWIRRFARQAAGSSSAGMYPQLAATVYMPAARPASMSRA